VLALLACCCNFERLNFEIEDLNMIKTIKRLMIPGLALFAAVFILAVPAQAEEQRGTAEQAQALVASVIAYYDANGKEATFAAIEDKAGQFVNYDLYVFVYGPDRTIVAHGADTSLNGTPVDTFIDIQGKPFGTALMDDATEEGVWIDYTWYNPVDRALRPKSSWVVLHDGHVFGAGIYLPDEGTAEPEAKE